MATLSMAAMLFLLLSAALSAAFRLDTAYVYTYGLLAVLALHIHLSIQRPMTVHVLYMLAMSLLVICGCALVLVAQRISRLDTMLLASMIALFMLVPIVPWGLREASATIGSIYLMFGMSTILTPARFITQDLWLFHFLMLFAALVSILLVTRSLMVRKNDLATQFELQQAYDEMQELSNRDHLTGAWNRRYLEANFRRIVKDVHEQGMDCHFALFDIDRFKQMNDSFGHAYGDQVLKAVEASFRQSGPRIKCLARLGGDEFAILLSGQAPELVLAEMLESVALRMPAPGGGTFIPLGFSVGLLTISRETPIEFSKCYRPADDALYAAKRTGGGCIVRSGEKADIAQARLFA